MTIREAIAKAEALTGSSAGSAEALRWLNGYDGKLAREFFRLGSWEPYEETDGDALLLVSLPWDGLYVHYLEAMTYYTAGEYQRCENARAMEARQLAEFKAWVLRRFGHPGPEVLAALLKEVSRP